MRSKYAIWFGATTLLAAPLIAMQLTDEVKWRAGDFATFGAMLVLACAFHEIAIRRIKRPPLRAATAAVLATAFILVWVELAVGLFH